MAIRPRCQGQKAMALMAALCIHLCFWRPSAIRREPSSPGVMVVFWRRKLASGGKGEVLKNELGFEVAPREIKLGRPRLSKSV